MVVGDGDGSQPFRPASHGRRLDGPRLAQVLLPGNLLLCGCLHRAVGVARLRRLSRDGLASAVCVESERARDLPGRVRALHDRPRSWSSHHTSPPWASVCAIARAWSNPTTSPTWSGAVRRKRSPPRACSATVPRVGVDRQERGRRVRLPGFRFAFP